MNQVLNKKSKGKDDIEASLLDRQRGLLVILKKCYLL